MVNEMSQPGSEMEGIYDHCCCKDILLVVVVGDINYDQVIWFRVKI